MRGASIIVLAMSGAGAGAASGTSSGLEVDTIAQVDFASVSETRVGAVSVGKSSDGKVLCNLFKDVERCDRCNVIASNVIASECWNGQSKAGAIPLGEQSRVQRTGRLIITLF